MLSLDFDGVETYRAQLARARFVRHETGFSIKVPDGADAATNDVRVPSAKLPVDACVPGRSWVLLHSHHGTSTT